MDTGEENEEVVAGNSGNAELSSGDLETFDTIQDELNRMSADEDDNVTHAMITADGTAVPVTMNPDTGHFMTADGDIVVSSSNPEKQPESILPDGGPTYQMINPDGTVTDLGKQAPQNIVILNADGTASTIVPERRQQPQHQNVRLITSDGSVVMLPGGQQEELVQHESFQQPQTILVTGGGESQNISVDATKVRIVSADGSSPQKIMAFDPGSADVVVSNPQQQQQKISVQQMVYTNEGKPVIMDSSSSSSKQQRVLKPSFVQGNNKVQYVRLTGAEAQKQLAGGGKTQLVTVRGGTQILPSGLKGPVTIKGIPTSGSNVVKIALPPNQMKMGSTQKMQRIIYPSPQTIKVTSPVKARMTSATIKQEPGTFSFQAFNSRPVVEEPKTSSSVAVFEAPGVRPRKPCNCTKSQCLKLYCDCFANGEFCNNCNCTNCFNNLSHEEARKRSIKQCLDRNPNAFRPKIGRSNNEGERRHSKGCNCKRSGCLKNYCECYEAKIPCTNACKCISCKNVEEETGKKTELPAGGKAQFLRKPDNKALFKARLGPFSTTGNVFKPVSGIKQPFNFVTTEVVEATCQCLLAQAEEAERENKREEEVEGLILEEFGRCLNQIIDMANKANEA